MTHRGYARIVIALAVASVAGFGAWGRSFEPLWGDLTRIGWYAEDEFGWTLPDHRFVPPLASPGRLDGSYDIIAVGDSFTVDEEGRAGADWPNFLARDTGLRIATFDNGIDPLETVLASPVFRDHAPAALVYEIVERNFVPQHQGDGACAATAPTPGAGLRLAPRDMAPAAIFRPTRRAWDDWPASYAINYLVENTIRRLRGHETTTAVRLEVTDDSLFSSRNPRGLLVYGEDFNKMGWADAAWDAAGCTLLRLQNRVQANGHTAFLAMVVPDKLTAYGPFLADRHFAGLSRLDRLAAVSGLNLVRLDDRIDPRREIDLYLPDDTHWSGAGYALGAEAVLERLLALGIVRR